MQQKLPKLAKSLKPCQKGANSIPFAPKCFVDFLLKALMSFEVFQKYWKLKEEHFLPLGVVKRILWRLYYGLYFNYIIR